MLRSLKLLVLLALSTSGATALAAGAPPAGENRGDAEAGAAKATVCAACHGQEGKAIMGSYPNLGGQHYSYLLQQMRAFKSGERQAALMAGQVDNLSDQDLRDIAAFYADMQLVEGVAEGEDLELGERIYRAGIADEGIPACVACHSPQGLGNGPAAFPVLSGQNADYVAAQLRAYRAGERVTDEAMGQMMRGVADELEDDEIEAVSAYVHGLH
jgi:cytochrome c553